MSDQDDKVTDDSSIKPVSSLRSRFENLGLQSSTPLRSPLPASFLDARSAGSARASIDAGRISPGSHAGDNTALGISNYFAPKVAPSSQPHSRQHSPPRVTVESPEFEATPPQAIPGSKPRPLVGFTESQPWGHSPKTSVSVRPNLSPSLSTSPERALSLSISPKTQRSPRPGSTYPPPVNRAGKPSISSIASGPTTPLINQVPSDSKSFFPASPFATPPSSSDGTPNDHEATDMARADRSSRSSVPSLSDRNHSLPRPSPARLPLQQPDLPPRLPMRVASTPMAFSSIQGSSDGNSDRLFGPKIVPPAPAPRRASPSPMRSQTSSARPSVDEGSAASAAFVKPAPPHIPAPRRSAETRRSIDVRPSLQTRRSFDPTTGSESAAIQAAPPAMPPRTPSVSVSTSMPTSAGFSDGPIMKHEAGLSDFPDASNANRRPPKYEHRPWELGTGYDTRLMTACGEYVCSGGYITRVWNLVTGESLTSISHPEGIKVTAMAWKPMKDVKDEGSRLWLGTNMGDLMELDIPSRKVIVTKSRAHYRGEVMKIFRHGSDLWSIDDHGQIIHWSPQSRDGVASLDGESISFSIPRGQAASVVSGKYMWLAHGKEIRVFNLTAKSDAAFNVLPQSLMQSSAGDVTCAATLSSQPNMVYFAHSDGKISVYDQRDFSLAGLFNVGVYKIHTMTGVGNLLWAGYSTGMIFVYDTSTAPWTVRKTWKAHSAPVCSIVADPSSIWKLDRFNVVSLGMDNIICIWDGMLEADWLDDRMQKRDEEYCTFNEITAAVMTWNAGASKPTYLRGDSRDADFLRNYMNAASTPDIFIFGFQELVDLEDKKLTAKTFFKSSKKKDSTDNQTMSHQYRAWRDHLVRCMDDYMPASGTYTLLQTADLVGLFSCIFVKTSLRSRIRQLDGTEVKRGMGGLHGNKGAVILRMIVDDSSLCLVNCHLAAGQTSTNHRNNDIAAIMESDSLPATASELRETFIGGGDGAMILDHEICILNGDLNYRIDAMTRDNVVRAVRDNNLSKLLDRDQLLLSRKRNPAFRLKLFQELPITFAPTYKYNVGTDDYDSSEKKRSPAWCDRILFRGVGRVQCSDYRRWEVHTSDHRPVSARFKLKVKRIDAARREKILEKTKAEYAQHRRDVKDKVKLDYLVNVLGLQQKEAAKLLQL